MHAALPLNNPSRLKCESPTSPLAVHFKLSKLKGGDDLVVNLHTLLFRRKGTVRGLGAREVWGRSRRDLQLCDLGSCDLVIQAHLDM